LLGVNRTVEGWKGSYGTGFIGSADGILPPRDRGVFHLKVLRTNATSAAGTVGGVTFPAGALLPYRLKGALGVRPKGQAWDRRGLARGPAQAHPHESCEAAPGVGCSRSPRSTSLASGEVEAARQEAVSATAPDSALRPSRRRNRSAIRWCQANLRSSR
jgi:hypothetical protein